MPMAKADFESVAARILDLPEQGNSRESVAFALADALVSQSNSFDPVLFLETCGLSGRDLPKRVRAYSNRLRLRLDSQRYE